MVVAVRDVGAGAAGVGAVGVGAAGVGAVGAAWFLHTNKQKVDEPNVMCP